MGESTNWPMGYSMPSSAPLYVSPPVIYNESVLLSVLLRLEPEAVQRLVPQPLRPNPDHLFLLNVNLLQSVQFGPYNEVILAVPALFNEAIGQYCMLLYVDNDAAIAAGREIWGFPKKQADITVELSKRSYTATVTRGSRKLLTVALELGEEISLEQLSQYRYAAWLSLQTWFNHKLIPSVKDGEPPVVHQLTSTTMNPLNLLKIHRGKATVVLHESPTGPLQMLERGEVMAGFVLRSSGTLPHGKVIYDYLQ